MGLKKDKNVKFSILGIYFENMVYRSVIVFMLTVLTFLILTLLILPFFIHLP